jgi:2-dehydro-3-deoxy-phosphogluconate aldolase
MNEFQKFNFLNEKVVINCLAEDIQNAKEVYEAGEGHIAIGLLSTRYPTIEENVAEVTKFQEAIPLVSIGLGGGSPKQWRMAAQIAAQTDPGHVNQVFPASGYTLGLLEGNGCQHTLVNALISPTGTKGKVKINTGVHSESVTDQIDLETALLMLKDIGLKSVKYFHMKGLTHLDELRVVAEGCKSVGIDMIEPTGGLSPENIKDVVKVCLESGVKHIMPHVYSSIIDPESGNTKPKQVAGMIQTVKALIGN